jgi:hypothetical protein
MPSRKWFCHSERSEESQIVSGSRALPLEEIARDVSLRSTWQTVCIYEMTSKQKARIANLALFADCRADIRICFEIQISDFSQLIALKAMSRL